MWMAVFVIGLNLLLFAQAPERDPEAEGVMKPSRAQELIDQRHRLEDAIMKDDRMAARTAAFSLGLVFFILAGIFVDIYVLAGAAGRKSLLARSRQAPEVKWDIWDAVKVVILFLFFGYAISIAESLIAGLFFPGADTGGGLIPMINTTILDILAVAAVFHFLKVHGHRIADVGLTLKNFFKNVYYGVMGYISVIPVLFAALVLTLFVVTVFKYRPQPQPIMEIFIAEEKAALLAYMTVFVSVLGPIAEEIFFRGFLYNAIKKRTGVKAAILISAVLFSCLHAHLVGFLPIIILGIFLAYLYEKTGSLVPSITVHVIHNFIMVYLVFMIKDIQL